MIPLIVLVLIFTAIGLAYIFSPIDLLPDVIPILGWSDDALIGALILLVWVIFFFTEFVAGYWWMIIVVLLLLGLYTYGRIKEWW